MEYKGDNRSILERCLEDLEKRIDNEIETELFKQWVDFMEGHFTGDLFIPQRGKMSLPALEWPDIQVNEAIFDYDKMALYQFKSCSDMLENGNGSIMCVRCNYGSSIIMSLFGAEMFYMDDNLNTLPTSRPISGGVDEIKRIIDRGVPDIYSGLGEKVFKMARYFSDIMKCYPGIKKHIHIYHPDMQGPFDICEVLWGSDLFIDIIDMPELVHELLELITQTYIKFMKEWISIIPFCNKYSVHWSMLHKGNIMLRNDSSMNLSPAMYDEFVKCYEQRLLNEFDGGAMHFCGRGDHYIKSASKMDGLYAVAMSQPEYNNMEIIYSNTVDKGIKLIGFNENEARKAIQNGRALYSNVHCSI